MLSNHTSSSYGHGRTLVVSSHRNRGIWQRSGDVMDDAQRGSILVPSSYQREWVNTGASGSPPILWGQNGALNRYQQPTLAYRRDHGAWRTLVVPGRQVRHNVGGGTPVGAVRVGASATGIVPATLRRKYRLSPHCRRQQTLCRHSSIHSHQCPSAVEIRDLCVDPCCGDRQVALDGHDGTLGVANGR